jgi:hypothetical protein
VVHEVGHARDSLRREIQALDQRRLGARRGRDRDRVGVVDVVCETDGDAALRGGREGARDELRGGLLEIEIVESEVERLSCCRDELSGVLGDLECALAAVSQCPDVECQAYPRTLR